VRVCSSFMEAPFILLVVRRLVRRVWIWGLLAWGFKKRIAVFFLGEMGGEEFLPHIGTRSEMRMRKMRWRDNPERWW